MNEMLDLFKAWDEDGNGQISKIEFRKAVAALGLQHEDDVVDAVFDGYDADKSGEIEYKEYVQYSLRDGLKRSSARVMTLFRQWDSDHSGTVDRKEFRKAVKELGFDAPNDALDEIFNEMDTDRGGQVDFNELNKVLRQGAAIHLSKEMYAGAAGEIVLDSKNKHGLRGSDGKEAKAKLAPSWARVMGAPPPAKPPPASSRKSPEDQLKDHLGKRLTEMLDLFTQWDADGNGQIDKSEFRKAVAALGLEYSDAVVDTVFDGYDVDGQARWSTKSMCATLCATRSSAQPAGS